MTETRPPAIVFCERIDNESFCAAVVRELSAFYDVRSCGPGWPAADLDQVDTRGVRLYLELDSASGSFVRPKVLERLTVPKFAWLIDTHKKPTFHREISSDMDLTFHAMPTWGHVLDGARAWLPVHCDQEVFKPTEAEREWDVVFVGSQGWRADAVRQIAERHGLRMLVTCTTGPREKSETAALYARAKVVFNRHVTNDLNFRVVEAMACGRALLTDAQANGQYELFEDERHYLLYKDDRDLERQLLRLLSDDELRTTIEREAAALAHARHTTRARVADLRGAIEAFLRERAPEIEAPAIEERATTPQRWLVLAGERPATVEQKSLAELHARGLAESGHDVVLAVWDEEPPLFPPPPAAPGEPRVVHLPTDPLPRRGSSDLSVEPSAALLIALGRVAEEQGPFDHVMAEGALGGLVAAPVAARLGVPFVLALSRCEVRRRKNRLTREQLHRAELEQWACERAARIVVETQDVAAAVRGHYHAQRVDLVRVPRRPKTIAAEGLLEALEVGPTPRVVLAPGASAHDAESYLGAPGLELDHDVVFVGEETWLRSSNGVVQCLSRSPAAGPALAVLLGAARVVTALEPDDPRLIEARLLGAKVEEADLAHALL